MAYKNKEDLPSAYQKPIESRLSEEELKTLDNELKRFVYTRKVFWPTVESVELLDTSAWLVERGALNAQKSVVIEGLRDNPKDCNPILYEQLMEDLSQWKRWRSKNVFVEKKKLNALSKLAAEKRLPPEQEVDN